MPTKFTKYLVYCVALLVGVFSYLSFIYEPQKPLDQGSIKLGGDFTVDTFNGPFRLADYRGKIVVIYFGFTSCPDVCPTALAMLGNVLKKFPTSEQSQIQPLFISVDPDRDTVDKIAQYGKFFHPNMISATAKKDQLDKIVKQYGAYYKSQKTNDAENYSVDHTSRLYIINQEGLFSSTVPHDLIAEDLAPKLVALIQ